MNIRSFAAELRRRKVFRVAAFYAAGGFVVAQAADILLPGLTLPPWSVTLVLALLILGFPLAIALAWAFDVTPGGVVRTPARAAAPGPAGPVADTAPSAGFGGAGLEVAPGGGASPSEGARGSAGAVQPGGGIRSGGALGPDGGIRSDNAIRAIAVLPFLDLSPGHENEYFSDGLTEEILNSLAKRGGLRVPARTSSFAFKGREADIREIGRTLGVEAVLEGSVRKAGDRVRITAQLVDVGDGYHRWSETFDRELEDVFAIQEEISSSIVEALGIRLSAEGAAPAHGADGETYDLCFRGVHDFHGFLAGRSEARLLDAVAQFESAVERDPRCAPAHAWHALAVIHLADEFRAPREVYPLARRSAERALALDPALAEAQAVLGAVHLFHDWDLVAAEARLDRALELNPNLSLARIYCSMSCSAALRHEDAIRQARLALDVDPLSPLAGWALGWSLYRARAHDAAAAHARTRLELDPGDAVAHLQLGLSRLAQGRARDALVSMEAALALGPDHPRSLSLVGLAAARAGDPTRAAEAVERLEARSAAAYVPPTDVARPYLGLGEADRALEWLDRAVETRDSAMAFIDSDPALDPLRGDGRFQRLRERVRSTLPAAENGAGGVVPAHSVDPAARGR